MKNRKKMALLLGVAGILTACGSTDDGLAKYVTLAPVSPLNAVYEKTEVTDASLDEAIGEDLDTYADYIAKDGAIVDGDYVVLELLAESENDVLYDYTGEDSYDMVIGSADFGEAFDQELIGKKVGDAGTFTADFDESFEDATLAGEHVTITYTLLQVEEIVRPALDDAFATELGFADLDAYYAAKREELEADAAAENKDAYESALLEALVEASDFKSYPASLKKEAEEAVEYDYQNFADMFGMELQEVYDMFGITDDTLAEEADFYAKQMIVFDAVEQTYQLTLSDEEFQTMLTSFAEEEEYDNVDEVLEEYEESELRDYFMQQKVLDYLVEQNPIA